MLITPINIFTKTNCNIQTQNNNLRYVNLPQNNKDEVSFCGSAKLIAESMADAPSNKDCIIVNTNAEPSKYYLQCVLDKYISQFVKSKDKNNPSSHKPVEDYYVRVKSPNSIREKVVSKYSKMYREDLDKFCTETVDQLIENFNMKKCVTREQLIGEAKKLFTYYQNKIPPFANSEYFFNQIVSVFEAYNIFDLSKYSPSRLKTIYSNILKNIEAAGKRTHVNAKGSYVNPQSISGIKHYANDIVGARIIMSDSEPNDTAIVLEAIRRASDDGYIKINSVESYIPDPSKLPQNKSIEDYEYATHKKLHCFANDTNADFDENMSKSGYLAIHINLELTDPILALYKGEYKGFSAEIQIMGTDVEKLKDVEDLCYKLKDNKNAINAAYLPFKKHFMKYYTKESAQAFNDYTYALYLAQRDLTPNEAKRDLFPSISELGFDGKVPPELDFNVLKKIKDECDIEYNRLQKIEEEANNSVQCETLNRIKKAGDISTLKNMIACKMK